MIKYRRERLQSANSDAPRPSEENVPLGDMQVRDLVDVRDPLIDKK